MVRLGVSIYAAYDTDSISCVKVSANQSFELGDLEAASGQQFEYYAAGKRATGCRLGPTRLQWLPSDLR